MHVPDIIEVKEHLENLMKKGLIEKWELPYENILTRRTAAIFFITPVAEDKEESIWQELAKYENFSFRANKEKMLSELQYRLTFSEEKQKL
ncbi:hypothetical protein A3860_05180 [Niastella vici]|uniref:Uncharacterized protein n=1 Tax=Niastella vici TaxID=1703345 RepID=A0A1V9FRY6_9BACT|nr:hypothetical protein [Niastella vici]OQP61112.1 hypothetical protein A3860_05180 [Niastella vici]